MALQSRVKAAGMTSQEDNKTRPFSQSDPCQRCNRWTLKNPLERNSTSKFDKTYGDTLLCDGCANVESIHGNKKSFNKIDQSIWASLGDEIIGERRGYPRSFELTGIDERLVSTPDWWADSKYKGKYIKMQKRALKQLRNKSKATAKAKKEAKSKTKLM